jgi:hypothetical protein
MGNSKAKFENVINVKKNNNNVKTVFNPTDPPPELKEEEAVLLKEVWESIKDDIHKVGVITFVK